MHESLKPFEDRVELGLLRRVISPCGNLVLYNYTDRTTFERAWDEYTLQSRGIIFEKATGKQIAKPFKKFFNFGENGTVPSNSCSEYVLLEKMDGSLGIIYCYNNLWQIATRGSFTSDQATYARQHLLDKYDFRYVDPCTTLLCEIIYPENRIVVPYGARCELVLLGAYDPEPIWPLNELHQKTCIPMAPLHTMTIEEAIEKAETLPRTEEGWVLYYPEIDYRIKIKGVEYLKIAKILANMSPLSLWEVMKNGKVPEEYLAQLPEEFRPEVDALVLRLEASYADIFRTAHRDLEKLPSMTDYREIGIFLKENPKAVSYPHLVFPILRLMSEAVDNGIMRMIRPTGNIMEERT